MTIIIKQNTQAVNQVPIVLIKKTTRVVDFVTQISLNGFYANASVSVEKPRDLDRDPIQQRSWKLMRFDVIATRGTTILTTGDCILYDKTYYKIIHLENFVATNSLVIYHTIQDFTPIVQLLSPPVPATALCELLQQFTQIPRDRVMLWNANFTLPTDNQTFIVVELKSSKITQRGKAHKTNSSGVLQNAVASGGIQQYEVALFSRDNSSLFFESAIESCFNSDLALTINERYNVGIANMATNVSNKPEEIGGSMIQVISFLINIGYSNYSQIANSDSYITPTNFNLLVDYGTGNN